MKVGNFNIIAPSIFVNEPYSEAEVLGAITLQWANHNYYREISIESMLELVIPIIKSRQFALFSKDNRPIGYAVWAFMNEETEADYIKSEGIIDRFIGCNNGKNLWILSLFTESGDTAHVVNLMRKHLFPTHHGKSLYHQGKRRGLKVMDFYGTEYAVANK